MNREEIPLDRKLRQEILLARERVYRFGRPTPIERLDQILGVNNVCGLNS